MTQFSVHPSIQLCDTCQELANTYELGPQDLLFTNDFLFDPYFAPLDLKCPVLFQEKYGLGEPTDEMVEAIYRDMPKDITRIVAVGGGTVLDVAKILSLRHVSPILDLYDGKLPVEKGKKLILVPTTCGTGTEVTNISILALVSRRTKKGLANDAMYADQAVLVPELLGGLPFRFFATSSIDALIHAIESSLSPKANPITKLFGYRAIEMILKGYQAIQKDGPDARLPLLGDFLLASNFAGIAFGNAGCAAGRCLSRPPRRVQLCRLHRRDEPVHAPQDRRSHCRAEPIYGQHPGLRSGQPLHRSGGPAGLPDPQKVPAGVRHDRGRDRNLRRLRGGEPAASAGQQLRASDPQSDPRYLSRYLLILHTYQQNMTILLRKELILMLRTALPQIVTGTLPGPKAKEIIDRRAASVPGAIRCAYPVAIERGEGAMIQDVDGNILMDWIGGVGVLNIGFSHPEIIEAVKAQADKYFHGMFNIVTHEGYVALAEKLAQIVPVQGQRKKVFFANSGAEADENAVKIAKAYTGRPNIIVFSGAFHGRTMLTMTMTAKKAYTTGMGPLVNGVFRAHFPDLYRGKGTEAEIIQNALTSVEDLFEDACPADTVAAIILEPLQGEGGFIPAPIEFVKGLRKICDDHGILLIADEVQSGFCRTGQMFASQYWQDAGCAPDILATAKSIAAGLPISAIIARSEIMDAVPAGTIGGTFCGNPLACAAALKTIEIMERDDLAARSRQIGEKVMARARQWQKKYPVVGNVRGLGAMVGIEFVENQETKEPNKTIVPAMVQDCVQRGLMIEPAGRWNQVIRFLAPLVITEEQLEWGLDAMEASILACMDK